MQSWKQDRRTSSCEKYVIIYVRISIGYFWLSWARYRQAGYRRGTGQHERRQTGLKIGRSTLGLRNSNGGNDQPHSYYTVKNPRNEDVRERPRLP